MKSQDRKEDDQSSDINVPVEQWNCLLSRVRTSSTRLGTRFRHQLPGGIKKVYHTIGLGERAGGAGTYVIDVAKER